MTVIFILTVTSNISLSNAQGGFSHCYSLLPDKRYKLVSAADLQTIINITMNVFPDGRADSRGRRGTVGYSVARYT